MVIEPKIRDFICTTAHPTGCREHVKKEIDYVKGKGRMAGPKKVLVIGASTGYGLASRVAAAFGCGAATIGVMFERPSNGKRTATPGWYNTRAFEEFAAKDGLYAKSVNGDAYSKEVKEEVISLIKEDLGQVDMVVYSLAAPRRTMADGTVYSSVIKTTGSDFTSKTLDLKTNTVPTATIPSATEEEVEATIKVMGGEDWLDWIAAMNEAGVLANDAVTVAYSYIGPELTHPIYYNGSIGAAKKDLYNTAKEITNRFASGGVKGFISVNKALVTQASAAIPVVPLYITILFKVMKEMGIHEACIEQMDRLFREKLPAGPEVDADNQIRLDDWEMRADVQEKVMDIWEKINSDNVKELADIEGYWKEFYHMFGFGFENVDYSADVSPE